MPHGWRVLAIIVALSAVIAGTSALFLLRRQAPSIATPAIRSVAVLPFKPIVANERDEALELGIADTLIAKLSNIRGITVRPLTAVRHYTGLEQDPIEAGRQLGVDAVLDGTTHNAGNKLRVNARLLRVADSTQLWTGQYDTTFADIFSVYDTISARLAAEVAVKITPDEERQLHKHDTNNP